MAAHRVKVGILIAGGIVLFGIGLFLIGSRQQLFSSQYDVYADFQNTSAIEPGAMVRVSGMDAGTVGDIDIPKSPSGKFRMNLKVDNKFKHLVREDSVASIETEGMVGNKYVDIKKGSDNSPECQPGCTLKAEESTGMGALMKEGAQIGNSIQDTITDLRKRADVAMQNITDITGHADKTLVAIDPNIRRITANTAQVTGQAKDIVGGIHNGQGVAGKLLVDKAAASQVSDTIANAKKITSNIDQASEKATNMVSEIQQQDLPAVHKTIDNAQHMTGQLDEAVGTFLSKGNGKENTAEAMRDTVHNATAAAGNLADDTEAIKHNFFLRGFFKRRGFYSLAHMTPSKYEDSKFVKKPAARVWLPAAGLFETDSNGKQVLTKEGPSILDQGMSSLVPFLPNNPIMIEAYSTDGSPAQRYRSSQERAEAVRQYVTSKYHLQDNWVGTIAFADEAPAGTGKTTWNGICLALVQSK